MELALPVEVIRREDGRVLSLNPDCKEELSAWIKGGAKPVTAWVGLDTNGAPVILTEKDLEEGGMAKVKRTLTVCGKLWQDVEQDD
jgi:hypothetical protein